MLALSSPCFVWPLENLMSHEQNGINRETTETNSDQSFLQSPPILDEYITRMSEVDGVDTRMVKKLNHNASERDRRRKINNLYCSLNSLIPMTDRHQKKKVSIPSTITRVVKYIPELRLELEKLDQKKEALKSKVEKSRKRENSENGQATKKQRRCGIDERSLGNVCISKLGDEEAIIQLCTAKHNNRVSDILMSLENEKLLLLTISSFESSGERVFYSLHLRVQGTQSLNTEMLRTKICSLYENRVERYS